jgi:predicted DNA-binding transcriptional regulator AlpA
MTPSMLTIADVALRLGVGHSTVRAYLARQQMPAATGRIGRTPWWAPEAIEPWLAERTGPRFQVEQQP